MTRYVNPSDCSKEQWLDLHGKIVFIAHNSLADVPDGSSLVCLVDNGPFRAAAVVTTLVDFKAFTDLWDLRPKTWYLVDNHKLDQVAF